MSIIEVISIISFASVVTIILCGLISNSDDMKFTGAFLLLVVLGIHGTFQVGAEWQRLDTQDKYILTPKSSNL